MIKAIFFLIDNNRNYDLIKNSSLLDMIKNNLVESKWKNQLTNLKKWLYIFENEDLSSHKF